MSRATPATYPRLRLWKVMEGYGNSGKDMETPGRLWKIPVGKVPEGSIATGDVYKRPLFDLNSSLSSVQSTSILGS
jgi:hypothetical protein